MSGSPLVTDVDLVTTELRLAGKVIPGDYQIAEIEVVKEIARIPWARVVLLDGSVADQGFALSETSLVKPGIVVEIDAGYHGANETIFSGVIMRIGVEVARDGRSCLVLTCSDKAVKMTAARASTVFHDKTDAAVMRAMVEAHGLTAEVDPAGTEHPQMVQYNCSDWDYLLMRAEVCGAVVVADGGTVSVRAPSFASSGLTVSYGESVFHAALELDAGDQPQATPVSSWSSSAQTVLTATGAEPTVNKQSDITGKTLAAVLGTPDPRSSLATLDQAALRSWSEARLLHARLLRVRGAVAFSGSAAIKPGQCVDLRGFGSRFDGSAFVFKVTHVLKPGLWRTETGFGSVPTAMRSVPVDAPPAAGLLPSAKGLQIGKVKQVHEDPDGQFRIKVVLPLVSDAESGMWARMAAPYAGASMGLQLLPETDDEVVIGYLDGDPTAPIVLGSLHSSGRAAPFMPDSKNSLKGLATASALKLCFDDAKKSVELQTPSGHKITMSDEAGSVVIVDSTGNRVAMEKAGVTIESKGDLTLEATGTVKISGKQGLALSTPMDASLKGMNLDLAADMKLAADGQLSAQLTSSAEVVVKGALVMIN